MNTAPALPAVSRFIFSAWLQAAALALALALPARAQAQATAAANPAPDGGWPKTITAGTLTFTLYQPQVQSLTSSQLTAKMALAVQAVGAASQQFGTVQVTANADIDKEQGVATLSDVRLTQPSFPGVQDNGASYIAALQEQVNAKQPVNVSLGRLEASMAISQASAKTNTQPVLNTPPKIIYSASPAVLVLVDGAPALRSFVTGYNRVINTRALIVLDQSSGAYYLRLLDAWMQAGAVEGPWSLSTNPPATLAQALTTAQGTDGIDLMDPTSDSKFTAAQVTVYVSTVATELVQTNGPANFVPIPNTQILYAQNTESQLFMYIPTQTYYFLVSGRWFTAPSLQNGPWKFVPYSDVPAQFAQIPQNHPSGGALVSIPGTPPAQQAVIGNSIPQTATLNTTGMNLTVQYDGAPQFQPITTTPMKYAVNTRTPVIEVTPTSYYAVNNGVWFVANTPNGPWAVAASVPPVIYTIPLSSPVHYVTYVQVYYATPGTVVVGYTPGYLGTVVAPTGVVVYGTGYVYPVYCQTIWVPPPPTYGYGAGFSAGFGTGFAFGFAAGWLVGSWCHPCGGGFGWNNSITVNNYHNISYNHYSSYNNWRNNVVNNHNLNTNQLRNQANNLQNNPAARQQANQKLDQYRNNENTLRQNPAGDTSRDNVLAGNDGKVYRQSGNNTFEQHDGSGWRPTGSNSDPNTQRDLQNQMNARTAGDASTRNYGYGLSRTPSGGFNGGGQARSGFEGGGARR